MAWRCRFVTARRSWNGHVIAVDDVRESVGMLEEMTGTARRVFGGAHPLTDNFEYELERARAALRAANLLDGLVYPVDPSWQRHWRVGDGVN